MHTNIFNHLITKTIAFATIFCLLIISFSSCSNDDDMEIIDPPKKERVIKLYANNDSIIYSQIEESPLLRYSIDKMGYDTIGVAYNGFMDKSQSIINSIQIIFNDDLELYYVEYCRPASEASADSFARWDNDEYSVNPLIYNVNKQDNTIKGSFKGNLYRGGRYHEGTDFFAVDSCTFHISK